VSLDRAHPDSEHFPVLERITAAVLLLVLLALGWMVMAAYWPPAAAWATVEIQAVAVIILLALALFLVSVVALLHTRRSGPQGS
jgi:hypothetical protein